LSLGFLSLPVGVYLADSSPSAVRPATRDTMQESDQKPKKPRGAAVSGPGLVREPAAQTLIVPRAGTHEEPDTANLTISDGERDAAPTEPSHIREEGETEGDGVERETLDAANETRIEQPFDPTRIRIATREPSVDIVMERIRRGEIDLAPDFQRSGDIWPRGTQSRLIESILLRIPLPVFYMGDYIHDLRPIAGLRPPLALYS